MFSRLTPRVRVAALRHSDNGQTCADFTITSANDSSTCPNLDGCRHLCEHSKYTECRYCASTSKGRNQMLHHVKTMHGGRKFACALCQRPYVTKGGLTEHVNKLHKKLSRYRCETCGKVFSDRCLYHDHIAAHSGVKRHTCPICEMKFTYKTSLRPHVLHIHPNETVHIV